MAGKAAAAPAGKGGDAGTLARRLAGQGLDRAGVIDGLTGLGYTKAQAASAADSAGMPATISPAGGADTPATPPAGGSPGKAGGRSAGSRSGGSKGQGLAGKLDAGKLDIGKPSLQLPRKLDPGDASGFAFGLLLYVLALSFIRYGKDGPAAWLRAKFLNQPMVPARGTGKPKGDAGDKGGDQPTPSDYRGGHRRRHQTGQEV